MWSVMATPCQGVEAARGSRSGSVRHPSWAPPPPRLLGLRQWGLGGGGTKSKSRRPGVQHPWPSGAARAPAPTPGPRGWASNNHTRGHSVSVLASWGGAESDAEWRGGYKMNGARAGWGWERGWGGWGLGLGAAASTSPGPPTPGPPRRWPCCSRAGASRGRLQSGCCW